MIFSYYCRQSAADSLPNQDPDAGICFSGHYCPEGTVEPYSCPEGTFSDNTGLGSVDECTNCTAGVYKINYFFYNECS